MKKSFAIVFFAAGMMVGLANFSWSREVKAFVNPTRRIDNYQWWPSSSLAKWEVAFSSLKSSNTWAANMRSADDIGFDPFVEIHGRLEDSKTYGEHQIRCQIFFEIQRELIRRMKLDRIWSAYEN